MHRRLSSAGQNTTNLRRAAVWRRSDLRRHQPRIARGWAVLMWLVGLFGTVGAFYGGFPKMATITMQPFNVDWHTDLIGFLFRLILAAAFQASVTYFQFVYSADWRHPGYFIPYLFDFGSNAFSYGPFAAPLLAAFIAALAGLLLPQTDTLLLVALVVAWIVALFLIGVFTRVPELTFVEDDTPQP